MTEQTDIAGYILAGGKGTRMGGRGKLYLRYEGKYLSFIMLERLDMLEKNYISVADIPEIQIGNAEWITDIHKDKGPLGGVLSGLLLCPQKALFVVPCDLFGVSRNLVEWMIQAYRRSGRPVFLQQRGITTPFPGIYTKEMIPVIERQRMSKNYRMRSLFVTEEAKEYIYLDGTEELSMLVNINTEEDYQKLLRRKDGLENGNSKRSTDKDSKEIV